jgi:predicted urease superfamily metal-dependent hydrolase
MYPVHRGSNEYRRRHKRVVDDLVERLGARGSHALFGHYPEALWPLLEAGLQELSQSEREAFIDGVTRAQAVLRDKCIQAVFASGRAEYLAPDNVRELLDYSAHTISIKKESVS